MESKVITINDFSRSIPENTNYMAEHLLLKTSERCDNFDFFARTALDLNGNQLSKFKESNLAEQYYLVEEVSKSNIEKAVFVMDHSNEKIVRLIKESRGNIKNFKYYNILLDMIQDLEKADTKNQEVMKAKEIIHELENHVNVYSSAFKKDNVFRKSVYYSSVMSATYTIIKEHLLFLDVTTSKNNKDLVLTKDAHYFATDKDNIQNLNHNLLLTRAKLDERHPVQEGVLATLGVILAGGKLVAGAISAAFAFLFNGAFWTSLAATGAVWLSANVLMAAGILSIAALYIITRLNAKPIADYLESYEYIKEVAKKSNLESDKKIFSIIDRMTSYKKKLLNVWKSDNSKNIQEYMKDLNKDIDVIKKYEGSGNSIKHDDAHNNHSSDSLPNANDKVNSNNHYSGGFI